jgi:hypothetical protein
VQGGVAPSSRWRRHPRAVVRSAMN